MKLQKYYFIFVYILTEKNGRNIQQLKWPKIQKTKIWNERNISLIKKYIHLKKVKYSTRNCCSKLATGLKCSNRQISKSIWVTSLFFCKNDSLGGELLWTNLVTLILSFWTRPILIISPVANFGTQSLFIPWLWLWWSLLPLPTLCNVWGCGPPPLEVAEPPTIPLIAITVEDGGDGDEVDP